MDINEFEISEFPQTQTPFVVDTDAKAEWAIRKLSAVRKRIAEAEQIAKDEIYRVEQWLESQKKSLSNDAEYFEALLITYGERCRTVDNRLTVSLPHGKIKSRATKAKVSVNNEEEFIAWAKDNAPDLLRVKESVNVGELNKLIDGDVVVTADGEVVPAVSVIPDAVNYTIETEEG